MKFNNTDSQKATVAVDMLPYLEKETRGDKEFMEGQHLVERKYLVHKWTQ